MRPRAVAIDRDVDALAERERRGIAPGLLEEAAQELGLVEERRRRDGARADEAVAELHGAPQRVRVVAAEPERRVRLLQGLRLHRRVLEVEELALEGDARLGPQALHEREPLGEARRPARRGETERGVDARVAAEPDPDREPPAAQVVERGEALGEVDRAAQRGEQDGGAEPHPLGARRRVRQERDRLEAPDPAQDVLDDPDALEAERLGARQELADAARVERALHARLGDRDAELDPTLHAANHHTGRGGIVWGAVGTADPNRHDQETAMNPLKELIAKAVDRLGDDLERLSHRIHDNPELGYAEVKAAAWLTEFLDAQGFKVERGVAGVETAFRATLETGEGPTIAILCEYDALPGIGHACGHNAIATAGVGAGAGLAAVRDRLPKGRVHVVGTPAEEGGGGKVRLMKGGEI